MWREICLSDGRRALCRCPDTAEHGAWWDPDAVAFYCSLVAYRDHHGHWLDPGHEPIPGEPPGRSQALWVGTSIFAGVQLGPSPAE
jgi:hypothetical protein